MPQVRQPDRVVPPQRSAASPTSSARTPGRQGARRAPPACQFRCRLPGRRRKQLVPPGAHHRLPRPRHGSAGGADWAAPGAHREHSPSGRRWPPIGCLPRCPQRTELVSVAAEGVMASLRRPAMTRTKVSVLALRDNRRLSPGCSVAGAWHQSPLMKRYRLSRQAYRAASRMSMTTAGSSPSSASSSSINLTS